MVSSLDFCGYVPMFIHACLSVHRKYVAIDIRMKNGHPMISTWIPLWIVRRGLHSKGSNFSSTVFSQPKPILFENSDMHLGGELAEEFSGVKHRLILLIKRKAS